MYKQTGIDSEQRKIVSFLNAYIRVSDNSTKQRLLRDFIKEMYDSMRDINIRIDGMHRAIDKAVEIGDKDLVIGLIKLGANIKKIDHDIWKKASLPIKDIIKRYEDEIPRLYINSSDSEDGKYNIMQKKEALQSRRRNYFKNKETSRQLSSHSSTLSTHGSRLDGVEGEMAKITPIVAGLMRTSVSSPLISSQGPIEFKSNTLNAFGMHFENKLYNLVINAQTKSDSSTLTKIFAGIAGAGAGLISQSSQTGSGVYKFINDRAKSHASSASSQRNQQVHTMGSSSVISTDMAYDIRAFVTEFVNGHRNSLRDYLKNNPTKHEMAAIVLTENIAASGIRHKPEKSYDSMSPREKMNRLHSLAEAKVGLPFWTLTGEGAVKKDISNIMKYDRSLVQGAISR